MVVKGIGIFMSNEALAIKGEDKAPTDIKEDGYQYCEVCGSNISRLNDLVSAIQAETERLLWISIRLQTLSLDSRSEPLKRLRWKGQKN